MLILTSMMGVSTKTWVVTWVMLEINTMMMCYMMTKNNKEKKMNNMNPMKYFMVQTLSSSIILLTITSYTKSNEMELLMSFMLMIKMGSWPIHLWYTKMLMKMNLKSMSMWVVMTWQKMLPVFMLNSLVIQEKVKLLVLTMAFFSFLMPYYYLKKSMSKNFTMTMSSMSGNGWLLSSCILDKHKMLMFMTIYFISTIVVMKNMSTMNYKKSDSNSLLSMSKMANLMGIPPLPLFWMKILVVMFLMNHGVSKYYVSVLLMSSCAMMFLYLNMSFSETMKMVKKNQMTIQ